MHGSTLLQFPYLCSTLHSSTKKYSYCKIVPKDAPRASGGRVFEGGVRVRRGGGDHPRNSTIVSAVLSSSVFTERYFGREGQWHYVQHGGYTIIIHHASTVLQIFKVFLVLRTSIMFASSLAAPKSSQSAAAHCKITVLFMYVVLVVFELFYALSRHPRCHDSEDVAPLEGWRSYAQRWHLNSVWRFLFDGKPKLSSHSVCYIDCVIRVVGQDE